MSQSALPPQAPPDLNKAYGAGGSAVVAGALAKILIRVVNSKWPGFLDESTTDAIDTLLVALVAFAGAYYVPHKS